MSFSHFVASEKLKYFANQLTVWILPVWIHLCSIRKRIVNNFFRLSTAAIYCYTPALDYNHCHGHPRGLFRPREAPLYSVRLVRDPDGSGVGQGGKCMHTQICSRSNRTQSIDDQLLLMNQLQGWVYWLQSNS